MYLEYVWGSFYITGDRDMEKEYTTFRGRLEKLRNRGMNISKTANKERDVIKKYNYYNLINGYKTPFLEDKQNYPKFAIQDEDFYILGTKPTHLEALYLFDESLRKIFLDRILKIEERLKDVLVQSFYEIYTEKGTNKLVHSLHRESEYLRRNYYNLDRIKTFVISEKSGFKYTVYDIEPKKNDIMRKPPRANYTNHDEIYHSMISIIYGLIGQQRKKNDSIQSYLNNHTYLPMWILANIMSFGNISKMFEIQKQPVQKLILQKLNLDKGTLSDELKIINVSRVIHILSIFRNSCAHNERFYCNNVTIPIDDEFMKYLKMFPQHDDVVALRGTTKYLNKGKFKKLESYRYGIYTLMFCISLFLNKNELKNFKRKIQKELINLKLAIPTRSYDNVIKIMGLDFDWEYYLNK